MTEITEKQQMATAEISMLFWKHTQAVTEGNWAGEVDEEEDSELPIGLSHMSGPAHIWLQDNPGFLTKDKV